MKAIFFVLFSFFITFAQAQDTVGCAFIGPVTGAEGRARCSGLCKNIVCEGGVKVAILQDTLLQALKVQVLDRNNKIIESKTLPHPPEDLSFYSDSHNLHDNKYIQRRLKNKLRRGDRIIIDPDGGLVFSGDIMVYENDSVLEKLGVLKHLVEQQKTGKTRIQCVYRGEPALISSSYCSFSPGSDNLCNKQKQLCLGRVQCVEEGKIWFTKAVCKPVHGKCPSSARCMLDRTVRFSDPKDLDSYKRFRRDSDHVNQPVDVSTPAETPSSGAIQ